MLCILHPPACIPPIIFYIDCNSTNKISQSKSVQTWVLQVLVINRNWSHCATMKRMPIC